MAKHYRVNAFVRINNAIISSLLCLGIKVWSFSLLTVRGRKSGKPIVTPLAIFVQDQKHYLIATYGVVNWVRIKDSEDNSLLLAEKPSVIEMIL